MLRHLMVLMTLCFMAVAPASPVQAQEADVVTAPETVAPSSGQTLEDILARQRGEPVDDTARRAATGSPDTAAGISNQLGTLGGASDSEVWRALRFGSADTTVSAGGEVASVLIQDGGMKWYQFRKGPLATYGGYLLIGTIVALVLFYMLRGKVGLDYPATGRTVIRFAFIERFGHWLLASSFILLGITGLLSLFGRTVILPVFGKEANAVILELSKFVHNNVAWPFMVALVMVFVFWVIHNLPSRHDLTWFAQAGGIVGSKHPPAKKFNAGQKIIFWSVILLGGSISMSGLSLLFPFELPLFAKTFAVLNDTGLPQMLGFGVLPIQMSPQEEMQYAQAWHAMVSFVLMAIIIAHIYIGSVGMEGAYEAMGSGEVDEAWAKQHHSLWLEELQAKGEAAPATKEGKAATPAE